MVGENARKSAVVERLTAANERLVDVLSKIFGLEDAAADSGEAAKRPVSGEASYVS